MPGLICSQLTCGADNAQLLMKYFPLVVISGISLAAMTFSGCQTPGESAGAGALTGAAIGGLAGGPRGFVAGALAGAVTGAVVGKIAAEQRGDYYYGDRPYHHYRYAHLTQYPGYVRSPYYPNALVDVRGFRSGDRIMDPQSRRIFILP